MNQDDTDKRAQRATGPRTLTDQPNKPADLAAAVGRVLAGHVGEGWAVRRSVILQLVRGLPGYQATTDRAIRGALESLREAGWLICNMMQDDGYFLAGSPGEYQQFRALYASYATTILARLRAMDRAASDTWGAGALQERLF